MPTIGSATKTIRFNPSDLELIESVMKKENTTFNNAVHILINQKGGIPLQKKEPKTDIESIEEMAALMMVPMDKLLSDIRELLEEGTLYYSDGRLINPRYEDFERICEKRKQDIDKTIANVVRQMGG